MRSLDVLINNASVGTLKTESDIWSFSYTKSWLEWGDSFPLSPNIPLQGEEQIDGSTKRYIQWFFDNLLPEEGARTPLAKQLNSIDEADSFGILAEVGKESAGALTLVTPGTVLEAGTLTKLSFEELNERILNLPRIPLNNKESKRMSIAGAQHKMLIVKHEGGFYEPSGTMPSTHILKPEHSEPSDYWQTVRNEWFVMTLAGKMGLDVPKVEVCYLPSAVYIIERFDRVGKHPNQLRLHAMDSCQTLGLSRTSKYALSNVVQLKAFVEKLRGVGRARITVFTWAIFNALVGNNDAHLKNLTCIVDPDGLYLSPMYDLVCTAIYQGSGEHLSAPLSQKMGDATTLNELTRENIILFGEELGLNKAISVRVLNKLVGSITREADKLYEYTESLDDVDNKAGELRMLREIRYNVIGEMVAKLSL